MSEALTVDADSEGSTLARQQTTRIEVSGSSEAGGFITLWFGQVRSFVPKASLVAHDASTIKTAAPIFTKPPVGLHV